MHWTGRGKKKNKKNEKRKKKAKKKASKVRGGSKIFRNDELKRWPFYFVIKSAWIFDVEIVLLHEDFRLIMILDPMLAIYSCLCLIIIICLQPHFSKQWTHLRVRKLRFWNIINLTTKLAIERLFLSYTHTVHYLGVCRRVTAVFARGASSVFNGSSNSSFKLV